jgi:hypothetical protein
MGGTSMVIKNKDLQIFYDCSAPTACLRKKEIIEALNITSGNIFDFHIAKYEGLTIDDVRFVLNMIKYH